MLWICCTNVVFLLARKSTTFVVRVRFGASILRLQMQQAAQIYFHMLRAGALWRKVSNFTKSNFWFTFIPRKIKPFALKYFISVYANFIRLLDDVLIVFRCTWWELFNAVVAFFLLLGSPLEQIHIFILAHVLRRPIIVYSVKYIHNYRDEPIGLANFEGQ